MDPISESTEDARSSDAAWAVLAALEQQDDVVTVVRCKPPLILAKRWRADGTITPYDKAKQFRVETELVSSVRDLSRALTKLERDPHACILPGRFVGHATPKWREAVKVWDDEPGAGYTYRRDEVFEDVPRHWLLVEEDGYLPLTADPVRDPVAAIDEYIATSLPAEFRGVSYHWQLSNSAGHAKHAGMLKAHIWFWMTQPRTSAELKAWAGAVNLAADHAVFQKIQVHYTSAPVFEPGVADPVPMRSGFVEGARGDAVDLNLSAAIEAAAVIDSARKQTRVERLSAAAERDPVVAVLRDRGMLRGGQTNDGALHIECPNSSEHTTDTGDSSTVYYPANTGGFLHGNFECKHDHCREMKRHDFLRLLGIDEPIGDFEQVDIAAADSAVAPLGVVATTLDRGAAVRGFPEPFEGVLAAVVAAAVECAPKPQPELATLGALIAMAACCGGQYKLPDGMGLNLYGCNVSVTGSGKDVPRVAALEVARAGGARIIGKPASGQGLEDALVSNTGTLSEIDEIAHVLGTINDGKAPAHLRTLAENLLKLFTASRGTYFTRVLATSRDAPQSRAIESPCFNLLGSSTPEKLAEALTHGNIADGLMGRVLYAFGRDHVPLRQPGALQLPQVVREAAEKVRRGAIAADFGTVLITYAAGVDSVLHLIAVDFDREAATSTSPFAKALFARSFEKVARIAGVLAAWECPDAPTITARHAEWARQLVAASNAGVLVFAERHMHDGKVQADAAAVLAVLDRIISGALRPQKTAEIGAVREGWAARSMLLRCSKLDKKRFDDAIAHLLALDEIRQGQTKGNAEHRPVALFRKSS